MSTRSTWPTYERRSQPLLSRKLFLRRFAYSSAIGCGLIALSLLAGMLGYHLFENLSWVDAFLNSSMLLGGMGPVDPPHTNAGKIFAGIYALYCGLTVIVIVGIVFAPVVHRFMHKFHLESKSAT
jgi:hypothetical protein